MTDLNRIKKLAGLLFEEPTTVSTSNPSPNAREPKEPPQKKSKLPPLPPVKAVEPDPPDHGMMPLFDYPEGSPEAKALRDLSPSDPRFPRATHFIHPDDSTGSTMITYDKFAKQQGWNEPAPLPYEPPEEFNPYDALIGGTTFDNDAEDNVKSNPNAEWLSQQSPEWRRDAESGKLDATGDAAWTNNDPVHGNPIQQPSVTAKYGPNPRMPDHEGPVTIAPYTFDQYRAANPGKPVPPGVVVPLALAPGEPFTKPIVPEADQSIEKIAWLAGLR